MKNSRMLYCPKNTALFSNEGFTLAEILIVLAIIGVIASMTIPTLIAKVQNQEYLVALKKEYSSLDNAFTKILADEGVEDLKETSLFDLIPSAYCGVSYSGSDCDPFFNGLKKYVNYTRGVTPSSGYLWYPLSGYSNSGSGNPNHFVFLLADGALMQGDFYKNPMTMASQMNDADTLNAIKNAGGHMIDIAADLTIDVNGYKKPNVNGRDVFYFQLGSDGHLYPMGGKDSALAESMDADSVNLSSNTMYWRNRQDFCGNDGTAIKNTDDIMGYGCAARIIEDGWQMNY